MAKKRKKRKNGLIIVLLVSILALLGIIILLLLRRQPEEVVENGRSVLLTEDNVNEFDSEAGSVEDGYYLVTMNTAWEFDDGRAESNNAFVANAKENSRTVYFDVILSDTDEVIYSSPYMPVGTELRNFALTKALEAGEYSAVVRYYLVDDEYKVIDDIAAEVSISILN